MAGESRAKAAVAKALDAPRGSLAAVAQKAADVNAVSAPNAVTVRNAPSVPNAVNGNEITSAASRPARAKAAQ